MRRPSGGLGWRRAHRHSPRAEGRSSRQTDRRRGYRTDGQLHAENRRPSHSHGPVQQPTGAGKYSSSLAELRRTTAALVSK